MNLSLQDAVKLAEGLSSKNFNSIKRIIFPPHPYLASISKCLQGSDLCLGGQDCHHDGFGAHTGDVSARMLQDCGASTVLLGHSERRSAHNETSDLIALKVEQAVKNGLTVIVCVGETLEERSHGHAEDTVVNQLRASIPRQTPPKQLIIAYEPVWAIGSGEHASLKAIESMHKTISDELLSFFRTDTKGSIPILYGGSVNPENAASILASKNVSGGLIGGASLELTKFNDICEIADNFAEHT